MQIWTFWKHHTFKYDFWEKTQYSNMNFWRFLVTPASNKEHIDTHNHSIIYIFIYFSCAQYLLTGQSYDYCWFGWIFTNRSGTPYPWPLHQNSGAREASVWSCWTKSPWPSSTSTSPKQYHKRSLLLLSHWTGFEFDPVFLVVRYFWIAARFSSAQVRVSLAQGLGMLEWPSSYSVKPSLKVARPWRKVKLNEACSLCIVK